MVKLTNIMIGTLCAITIYISLFTFLTDGINQYGTPNNLPTNFNNSYSIINNQLNNINETTASLKNQMTSITAQSGVLDYLGFFFNAGYKALTSAGEITESIFVITDTSLDNAGGFGSSGEKIKLLIYGIIIILFFVGIIMHAIIKSDRI